MTSIRRNGTSAKPLIAVCAGTEIASVGPFREPPVPVTDATLNP